MGKKPVKWRKILLITLGITGGLFLLLLLVLSPLLKFFIEKYDEQFTGRQITLDWAIVNPLTGYVHLEGIEVYEQDSGKVFLSADGISARLSLSRLIRGEYRIDYLTLSKPDVRLIQYKGGRYNFGDLVEKFSGRDSVDNNERAAARFSLLDIKIEDGTFHWQEQITPVNYFIKDVFVSSSGFRWNTDSVIARLDFNSGLGSGKFEIDFALNTKNSNYHSHVVIRNLDLAIIEQYLRDFTRFGKFHARINLDITADGNLKDARNIDAVGGVGIYDFRFGRNEQEDLVAFKKFVMKIDHLNPLQRIYEIDSISLVEPFARYEKYDHLDNVQRIFGEKGSKLKEVARSQKFNLVIAIADYVNLLGKNFFRSTYKINRIGVYGANLQYHDYSLNEKFSIALQPLTLTADSLNSSNQRAFLRLRSAVRPYGNLRLNLSVNPKDSSDFDLDYHLENLNAAVLNPYLLRYTSYPLDRGSIELKGNWKVLNGNISSNNHLMIIDPRISERVSSDQNKWLPMRLIMFVVRERGNAIDYEIPIKGNLRDPKFKVGDVLTDALINIFVKPATTRYRHEIKSIETDIERQISFNWSHGSAEFLGEQDDFVKQVASFLRDNQKASIEVFPVNYKEKEKEHIAFFEARKKYFLETHKQDVLSEDDSLDLQNIPVKDSSFNRHMREKTGGSQLFTQQQLCEAYVGSDLINKKYSALKAVRRARFLRYFEEEKVQDRVKINNAEDRVPFNGFSYYQISYAGQIPEEMRSAYEKLLRYDNRQPRSKLKKERKKTRRFFDSKGGKGG